MNSAIFKQAFKTGAKLLKTNAPSILTGIGVAGMITAVVVSGKTATRAEQLLAEKEAEKGEELDIVEKATVYAKAYWKVGLLTATSAGLILGADVMHLRRFGTAGAAYSLMMNELANENTQLKNLLGEKKVKNSREENTKQTVENVVKSGAQIIETGKGDTVFVDLWTRRIFKHDFEKIRRAVNDLNDDIYKCRGRAWTNMGEVTLNDIYDSIGIDRADSGECVKWDTETGPIDPEITSVKLGDGLYYNAINWGIGPINITAEYM